MQPAQPFGRRGVVAAPQARFGPRQTGLQNGAPQNGAAKNAATQTAQRPEPTLASLGLERLGSAASSSDRGVLWLLFSVQGRLGQGNYRLVRVVLNVFAIFLFWSLARLAMQQHGKPDIGMLLFILVAELTAFPLWIWTTVAMQIKRWHDRDKPAIWMLVGFIPIIGPLWTLIELAFLPGTSGPNRFGPSPNSGDTAAVFE